MSISKNISIKCPKCGNIQEVESFASINVAEDMDLRDKVVKKQINIFSCEKCGAKIEIGTPLLYHDAKNAFMIYYIPTNDVSTVKDELNAIKPTLEAYSNELGYNFMRITNTYDELMEKILIAENGLDDRIIELVKIALIGQMQDKPVQAIFFDSTNADKIIMCVIEKEKNYALAVGMSSYDTLVEKLGNNISNSDEWLVVDQRFAMNLLDQINGDEDAQKN